MLLMYFRSGSETFRMQPQNRVMVPSQELPIQINQQVQPVDRGSRRQPGIGSDQHKQPESNCAHLHDLLVMQERQALGKGLKNNGVSLWLSTGVFSRKKGTKSPKSISIRASPGGLEWVALCRSRLDTKMRVPTIMCSDKSSEVPKPRDTVPQVLQGPGSLPAAHTAAALTPWGVPLEGTSSNCQLSPKCQSEAFWDVMFWK